MTIKRGDVVTFKPEWRDDGDDEITFVALEDEDGGRVRVGALGVLHSFIPNTVVSVDWLVS